MHSRSLQKLSVISLIFTVIVVVWGAFVRLSGSGDGCGKNWPLCAGVLIPKDPTIETIIEFTHRVTSGGAFLLVLAVWYLVRRRYGNGAEQTRLAWLSFVFMVIEALLGAALVLSGWVDQSQAFGRVILLSLHLVNTFVLVSLLTLTAVSLGAPKAEKEREGKVSSSLVFAGFTALCVAGVTGVIAALGNAQVGALPLTEAIRVDFDPNAPLLARLRILHPLLSVAAAWLLWRAADHMSPWDGNAARRVRGILVVQIAVGILTVITQGPLTLKLLHLLIAQALVISYASLAYRARITLPGASRMPSAGKVSFREQLS